MSFNYELNRTRTTGDISIFAFEKLLYLTLFTLWHLQIFTNQDKLAQNVYCHKINDDFYYGPNSTRMTGPE